MPACPKCRTYMRQIGDFSAMLECPKCGHACSAVLAIMVDTMAEFKPTKKTRTDAAWDILESDIVTAIQKALDAKGYTVLRIGQWKAKGAGNTIGTPDLFVHNGERWHGLEVKRPGGKVRPEQQDLADRGLIRIVDNVDDAVAACEHEGREG